MERGSEFSGDDLNEGFYSFINDGKLVCRALDFGQFDLFKSNFLLNLTCLLQILSVSSRRRFYLRAAEHRGTPGSLFWRVRHYLSHCHS